MGAEGAVHFLGSEGRVGYARERWVILCTCFWRGTGQAQGLPLPVWGGGVGVAALLCKAVMRADEEIDVAVGAGVAAGVAAEEDDLLRVEFLGDQLSNGLNCRPVDRYFGHLRETSLRMFCHALA